VQATRTIAVVGATGKVGRHVADVLTERGCGVVAMSRASGVDVATGDGLAAPASAEPRVSEIVGPREEDLVEVARLLAARRGDPVRIEGVLDPSDPDRDLLESDARLHGPDAIHAGPTFQEWLAASPPDAPHHLTPAGGE
jgi:nucleoside-diphosphate-sugar epimerase